MLQYFNSCWHLQLAPLEEVNLQCYNELNKPTRMSRSFREREQFVSPQQDTCHLEQPRPPDGDLISGAVARRWPLT